MASSIGRHFQRFLAYLGAIYLVSAIIGPIFQEDITTTLRFHVLWAVLMVAFDAWYHKRKAKSLNDEIAG